MTKYVPTRTFLFTFENKTIPSTVQIFGLEMRVEPYLLPVTQCYNCLHFGHTAKNSKGNKTCITCGHHISEKKCETSCNHFEGTCTKRCIHCDSSEHNSTDKKLL